RRTAKEKLEMVQTANEGLISDLLSVIDDFERAEKSFKDNDSDIKALKEGLDLISGKFKKILEQKGLKTMEHKQGSDFDPEFHEAITQIPAPKKKLKGKIVDVIEKGYLLKDKVVRYAKVVIGS
ncbi:MAG: nucleotide exchange factor GrpE, partial [Bacteroidota bacterium]